ncbi:MAG: class I SAM-dependent methyltransferase [Bryobacteraceae bacterium]
MSEADILRAHGRNYARLMGRFMKPASVLDVGAAAGFVLKGFIDSGWTGKGIEPNARMAGFARTELGLNVDLAPLESYSGAERFNLIVMIQVVAHFFDVRRAFEAAAGLTRPNGFWLIETWDRKSWTARILGKHWYEYSPPSVLRWFTPDDLKRLAKQFGFEEVARGHPVKRISGAHAKSLLQYKLSKHWLGSVTVRAMEIIPNRLVLPHPSEDLFWMLLQKRGGA